MDMTIVMERIKIRLEQLGRSEAAVSRAATQSPDTIRNWRRRMKTEQKFGASTTTLERIAKELGVSSGWLTGEGAMADAAASGDRSDLMEIYDSLQDPRWKRHLLDEARRLQETVQEVTDETAPTAANDE